MHCLRCDREVWIVTDPHAGRILVDKDKRAMCRPWWKLRQHTLGPSWGRPK